MEGKKEMYNIIKFLSVAGLIASVCIFFASNVFENEKKICEAGNNDSYNPEQYENDEESGTETEQSAEIMGRFFDKWYQPYGRNIPMNVQNNLINEISKIPKEPETDLPVNQWQCIGPFGFRYRNTTNYSAGRIRDIEAPGSPTPSTLRFAAASGGVWRYIVVGIITVPVSFGDKLPSPWVGSLCTHPTLDNTVFVGTGEPTVNVGLGMFKTTDLGLSWAPVTMSPTPSSFYKIRFQQGSTTIMHCAAGEGYYRSTDGGTSWTRYLDVGSVTDFSINPSNSNIIYAGVKENGTLNGGLWKSTTNGINWLRVIAPPIPVANVKDIKVSFAPSNSQVVYVNASRNDNGMTLGVYKTTNDGASWQIITPGSPLDEFHGGQGGYNDALGVSPTDPNLVIAGGKHLIKSTDGGTSWSFINVHADQHIVRFNRTGSSLLVGNDGGMQTSSDQGVTWANLINTAPITQFYSTTTPMTSSGVYTGGTQDNGTPISSDGGFTWFAGTSGDGAGSSIDPANNNLVFSFSWTYLDYSMYRWKSTDGMQTAAGFNAGIPPNSYWWGLVRHDRVPSVYYFTNSGPYIYSSASPYNGWTQMNATPFPFEVWGLDVSKFSGITAVYASLNASPPSATAKLRVFDGSSWSERSSNLPVNVNVRGVSQHPVFSNTAYAYMEGFSSPGQKIYKTTNTGVNWVNITGNLPNAAFSGLVPHPTNSNIIVAGTNIGMFKTTNGGANWFTWTNGMPDATIISDLTWVDSTAINGKFNVVIGTFGRSMWTREINGDDLTGITPVNNLPAEFKLEQNYPNPFNPATTIKFSLPSQDNVQLKIYDIMGREVETLVNENMQAGIHEIKFDGSNLSSGVYFYKTTTSRFTDIKKMVLVK